MDASPLNRSRPLAIVGTAVAVVVAIVVALLASGALGRAAEPSPRPSGTPAASPNPYPSSPSSPRPTLEPSDDPAGVPGAVALRTRSGHAVSVVIDDHVGTLVGASTGQPAAGMSVRWFDDIVRSVDPRTIELTWVGLPVDEEATLLISEYEGGYRLHFAQANPPLYSDAVGYDRVLVLEFDQPIDPDLVVVTFQGGPENEG